MILSYPIHRSIDLSFFSNLSYLSYISLANLILSYLILSDLIYLVLSMLRIFSYLPYHVISIVSCRIYLIYPIYPILSVTYTHADMHMQGRNSEILRYFGMESAESWGCWLVRELMWKFRCVEFILQDIWDTYLTVGMMMRIWSLSL